MRKLVFYLLFVFLVVTAGCSEKEQVINREQLSESAEIAKSYLEEKGYDVILLVSDISEVLTQEYLESTQGQQEWNVQPIKPDKFIGKTIDRVMFIVKNHPLNEKYQGEILCIVFLYEKDVIGGTSFALDYDGAVNYLDGTGG